MYSLLQLKIPRRARLYSCKLHKAMHSDQNPTVSYRWPKSTDVRGYAVAFAPVKQQAWCESRTGSHRQSPRIEMIRTDIDMVTRTVSDCRSIATYFCVLHAWQGKVLFEISEFVQNRHVCCPVHITQLTVLCRARSYLVKSTEVRTYDGVCVGQGLHLNPFQPEDASGARLGCRLRGASARLGSTPVSLPRLVGNTVCGCQAGTRNGRFLLAQVTCGTQQPFARCAPCNTLRLGSVRLVL